MAKSYRDVLEEWERAKAFGYEGSLKDYSQWQNALHETTDYSEGLRDGVISRASTYLDQALDATGLPQFSEAALGDIGAAFGYEEVGRQVGRSLPRSVINMAPLFIPGVGPIAGAARALGTGALMGLNTYADTGSAGAGLVSGAAGAAMPLAGKIGGNLGARLAGAERFSGELVADAFGHRAGSAVNEFIPTTFGQRAGQYVGSQAGALVPSAGGAIAQQKITNPDEPFDFENFAVETLLSQIPFSAIDAVQMGRTKIPTKAEVEGLFKTREEMKQAPVYTPPPTSPEAVAARDAVMARLKAVAADPNIPANEKSQALLQALTQVGEPAPTVQPKITPPDVAGENPVTIIGRADKINDGSYRVLVDDVQSALQLNISPGETVFVNDSNVVFDEATGRMKFETKINRVKPARKGLTELDFGVRQIKADPLQPELPVQGEPVLAGPDEINAQADALGARIEAARARLTTPEVAALVEMGVTVENVPEDAIPQIKESVAKIEQAQQDADNAQEKVLGVPQSTEEVLEILGDTPDIKVKLDVAITDGATPKQAVEEVRLQEATKEVDAAKREQRRAAKVAREAAMRETIEVGRGLISLYSEAAVINPDSDRAAIGNAIVRAIKVEPNDPKYLDRVARVVAKWQRGEYGDTDLKRLEGLLGKTSKNAHRKASVSIESYLVDAQGKRATKAQGGKRIYRNTREEIDELITTLPDAEGFTAVSRGSGDKKRWFVGKRLFPVGDISFNQAAGDGTATVADIIGTDDALRPNEENLGKLSIHTEEELVSQIDELIADTDDFASYVRDEEASQEDVLDVQELLTELKSAYAAKLTNGTPIPRELQGLVFKVMDYTRTQHSYTLDSFVPGDETLAQQIGLMDATPENFYKYIAQQKNLLGPVADLVELQLPFTDFNELKLRLPGERGWKPTGWTYHDVAGMNPEINVPRLPDADSLAKYLSNAAHELIHFNERKLEGRGDAEAVAYRKKKDEIIRALRVSPLVPKPVRELIARGIRENHLDKLHTDGGVTRALWNKALAKHPEYYEYVYGMLDPSELSTVMFTDPKTMEIALKTPVPKTAFQSVMHWFSNALNRLFRGTPKTDNVFADLVRSYDNYLASGRRTSVYNGFDLIRTVLIARGVRPDALHSRLDTVNSLYSSGGLQDSINGFLREQGQGVLPATAEQGELKSTLRDSLVQGEPKDVGRETMNLLAAEVPLHQELYRRMKEDVEIAEIVLDQVRQGAVPGRVPEGAAQRLARERVKLNAMKRALAKQANALEAWEATQGLTIEGWEQNQRDLFVGKTLYAPPDMPELDAVRKASGLERLRGEKTINPIASAMMLTPHIKEQHPALKAGIQAVSWEQSEAHYRATLLNGGYSWDGKQMSISKERLKTIERVSESPALSTAVRDLRLWINKEGKGKGLNLNDPFVKKVLSRYSNDRQAILDTIESMDNRHHMWSHTILPREYGRLNIDNTALLIVGKEPGMLPDTARELSAAVYDGLAQLVDPATAPVGMEKLRVLAGRMQPETYTAALTHAQGMALKLKNALDVIQAKPGWVTEQRYGKHQMLLVNPTTGETSRSSSNDLAELRRIRAAKERQGFEFVDLIEAEDLANPRFGIKQDLIQNLEELESQNEVLIRQVLANDQEAMLRVLSLSKNSTTLRAAIAAAGPMPGPTRRFRAGREDINMIDNANQYYVRMNNYLRNKLTRAAVNLEMMHPEIAGNSEYRKYLQQHVDNFLTPDNPIARKIVEATYFAKLGFDVGQAIIEGTQQLTTGMAELIAETGSVTDAFKLSAKMNKMVTEALITKKWASKEHEDLSELLKGFGHSGIATWGDIVDADTHIILDANRGKMGKVTDKIKYLGRYMSTGVSKYNDLVIAHAAFELARQRGETFEQAVKTAIDVKQRSLYTAGKAGRSVGFWSISSRPVPQLLGALTNYTLGWFGQMAVNYSKGFGKNPPKGLTPEQRVGAKKAFFYTLATQFALAGGLGLPGVGQGLALFYQVTGVDLKGEIRRALGSLFQEDEEYGGFFTGLALRGVGSAGLPVDPSNRTNISVPFLGVDSYNGMRLANFGGVTASTAADLVEGVVGALSGDMSAATKAMPSALKRPATLWQGEGDIRDSRGGLLHETSVFERAMMTIGLQPSRVTAARDAGEVIRKANDRAAKQKAQLVDSIAELVRKGKVDEAQQAIVELRLEQPDLDIQELLRSIANRVSAQTLPYDARRDLNPGASLAGVGASVPPSEVRRREIDKEVFRAFGVPLRNNFRADREAELVDQMLESDPFLTRREALEQIRGTSTIARRRSALTLPAYLQ